MGLIIFLVKVYAGYLFIKFLGRLFSPFLFKYLTNKIKSNFNNTNNKPEDKKSEGEVTIDKMPNKKKPSKNNVGDYVDYEEVE